MPYDRFARELLTASGSNFRVPPVNFYRAVQGRSPQAHRRGRGPDLHGRARRELAGGAPGRHGGVLLAVGYKPTGEWKEEIVFFDSRSRARRGALARPCFPTARRRARRRTQDPREVFADWLVAPENPWFARNIANRVWSWLLGRGIVHEPDDIRPDNPPSNPELLA